MTQIQEARVQVGDLFIAYRRAGAGPPIVLLHGFLCDSRCWEPQLRSLASDHDVIAWDAPGAGLSTDPSEGFSTIDYARTLAEFLAAVGIDRACLVGLSWGGILAQVFYKEFPARIDRLVLAGAYAGWRGSMDASACADRLDRCLQLVDAPPRQVVESFMPGFFSEHVDRETQERMSHIVADFHPVGFKLMTQSSAQTDTRSVLPTIQVPTLLLWGELDRRSPLTVAAQFQANIPDARLVVLPGVGHVSNMEASEAFNEQLRGFVSIAASG